MQSCCFANKTNRPFYRSSVILNLLDLRSIMECPRGTCSVFTRVFRAKRELQCIFLGKKAITITSKHGTTIFFSHFSLRSERGTFFRLQVHQRVGISLNEVYESVGKSVKSVIPAYIQAKRAYICISRPWKSRENVLV